MGGRSEADIKSSQSSSSANSVLLISPHKKQQEIAGSESTGHELTLASLCVLVADFGQSVARLTTDLQHKMTSVLFCAWQYLSQTPSSRRPSVQGSLHSQTQGQDGGKAGLQPDEPNYNLTMYSLATTNRPGSSFKLLVQKLCYDWSDHTLVNNY